MKICVFEWIFKNRGDKVYGTCTSDDLHHTEKRNETGNKEIFYLHSGPYCDTPIETALIALIISTRCQHMRTSGKIEAPNKRTVQLTVHAKFAHGTHFHSISQFVHYSNIYDTKYQIYTAQNIASGCCFAFFVSCDLRELTSLKNLVKLLQRSNLHTKFRNNTEKY